MKRLSHWKVFIPAAWGLIFGCLARPGGEGSAGAKVFLALGICLAAIFPVFYIVVKGREKD
ncbi:MAG: hypothetical protein HY882_09840 [Deltaproteobacteria bacterium]|nr:hypothetical protein [Deltaproteobacteria bacterium]